ncbi:MAG: MBL fold metallo-hydrolase [Kiritimatiellae bacterium]|nr:MBL fold metallo-hydrolase [Kiritimatiellia bacterium]
MNGYNLKLRRWRDGDFQIHFIHTGVGESVFIVFPDSTTMLIDAGDHPAMMRFGKSVPILPSSGRMAGEWVARYVLRANPRGSEVDYAMVSHFHADHAGTPIWQIPPNYGERPAPLGGCARSGIGIAAEQLHFGHATDRGMPSYADPLPLADEEVKAVAEHVRGVWEALARRDGTRPEPFRLGATDQFAPLHGKARDFFVRNICANGRIAMPDGTIRDIYAGLIAESAPTMLNENAMSLGMVFTYGKFRFVTCGDFSDTVTLPGAGEVFIEDILAEAVPKCNVAKANHHAHHSIGARLAAALRPQAYVLCGWDQLHCTDDSVEAMLLPGAPDSAQPLIIPTAFPMLREGEKAWRKFVPSPCMDGCHIVVTVPSGADSFTISLIDARDEEMSVVQEIALPIE